MGRLSRAISMGALLGVLGSLLVSVPAQAATFSVLNQCSGGSNCREDRFLNVSANRTAPYQVTFRLGESGCSERVGDRVYKCRSARTASENTGTSIKWRYRQETSPGVFTNWFETTNECRANLSISNTYCVDGEHLDTFVVNTPGSTFALQVHFKIVSGENETIWLANNPDGWRIEYIHGSPNALEPTASISSQQFVLKNEVFSLSGENSNPNDETGTISSSTFAWDMNYIQNFTSFSSGQSTRTHFYTATGTYVIRMRITNRFGNTGIDTKTIYVSEAPPSNTPSLSLTNNRTFTNQPTETFDLVWPTYANTMSLEDGTTTSTNRALNVSPTWDFNWGQVDGETKTLTAKFFDGAGNQLSTELSQVVTFDSTVPVINNVSATRTDGALVFTLSATDQLSGLSVVEISDGTTTVTPAYGTSIPSYLSGSNFTVRVQDRAGNWSALQNVVATNVTTPPPSVPSSNTSSPAPSTVASESTAAPAAQPTTPRVAAKSRTSAASVASQAGVPVTPGSKVSLTVSKSSKAICRVSGGRLVALKPGNCQVTVSVTPKKTKQVKKPKAVRTPTTVVVG